MGVPTPAEVRSHFETDLDDAALQRIIDREAAEIDVRFGSSDSITDELLGGGIYLFTSRPVGAVTSIAEINGSTSTTLVGADYILRFNGIAIERLSTGTNVRSSWGDRVRVTYTPPSSEDAIREMVIIDLVKLAIQYNGLKSEVAGQNHEAVYNNYQQERLNIMSTLEAGQRLFS